MTIIPNFAVFEGGDGSGTSTQMDLLKRRFAGRQDAARCPDGGGPGFFPTFEPTEGPAGKIIRAALRKEIALLPETLARLFAADRGEHLCGPGGVLERARRGELVVSDRYVLSSLVYQGLECGDELPRTLNAPFPAPELILLFDLDPAIAAERLRGRPSLDIYEYREFQEKVRDRYRALVPLFADAGVRVEVIDAARPPEEVAESVWRALGKMPIMERGV
jgi:dTMP kinase